MQYRLPALAATNVLTAVLLLGTACDAGIGRAAPRATAAALPSPQEDTTSIAARPDVTAVARGSQVFTGTIVHAPGARVRYGPGTDMPVMDLDPVGRTEQFDGWFRRADDTPLPDELTGRIEQWSWDWFHLMDGRGWVHSSAVKGRQLPGMPQVAWHPPASLPNATAAVLDIPFHAQDHPVTCEIASLAATRSGVSVLSSGTGTAPSAIYAHVTTGAPTSRRGAPGTAR